MVVIMSKNRAPADVMMMMMAESDSQAGMAVLVETRTASKSVVKNTDDVMMTMGMAVGDTATTSIAAVEMKMSMARPPVMAAKNVSLSTPPAGMVDRKRLDTNLVATVIDMKDPICQVALAVAVRSHLMPLEGMEADVKKSPTVQAVMAVRLDMASREVTAVAGAKTTTLQAICRAASASSQNQATVVVESMSLRIMDMVVAVVTTKVRAIVNDNMERMKVRVKVDMVATAQDTEVYLISDLKSSLD